MRVNDPDNDALRMTVDYSIDGGRRWRPIYGGGARQRLNLPSRLFAGSPRARVRVRVSDGFHETAARSKVFRAVGSPPMVFVQQPRPGTSVAADSALALSAVAHDDRGRRIQGRKRFRWFDGRRLIARGPDATISGLRAGRHRIRVTVRDARGQTDTRRVRVRLEAVRPQLISLGVPAKVGRRTRKLKLTVRASVPTVLQALGAGVARRKRFAVSRRKRRIVVRIRPGEAALALELKLGRGATRLDGPAPRTAQLNRPGAHARGPAQVEGE